MNCPQAYKPLFVWATVQLLLPYRLQTYSKSFVCLALAFVRSRFAILKLDLWASLYRLIKVALLKSKFRVLKAGVHLNGIFAPLNTGLVQISRWHFKQSKNSMLKT